ncbi:hypothetical protein CDJ04_13895 [Salmonella enterica]|nr:hypothetical protein [Salmonella enterica]EBQ9480327.1 hypothetical protein [Salmonella enterica subsp. enterica serovar Kokomlemle]EBZ5138233.1 hypothetical protein [Salmonella enterica subsp. enterica serovar Antsalova]EDL5727702.1 hypothetical protein [Salmonella enterica subsp. enterica serovar Adelaide]EDX5411987.1 hypothetical protein [Salmonella enterica subsp. enterica serovar Ealing]EHI8599359.1 hypothetical protein [Salmonella enterica subsp. enterica serovar 51:z:1,5]
MWRKIYQDALTASQKPPTPEQRLVMFADLRGVLDKATANTRHNQKAEALAYIRNWMEAGVRQAMSEIKQREKGE